MSGHFVVLLVGVSYGNQQTKANQLSGMGSEKTIGDPETLKTNSVCRNSEAKALETNHVKTQADVLRKPQTGYGPVIFLKPLPYVTQQSFQVGNQVSGPNFSRILVGKTSKSALRTAQGKPEGRFQGHPD